MTGGMLCRLLGSSTPHDLAPLIATIGTVIDDSVGATNHIEVVLNHEHEIALIHELLDHIHELVHVAETQARRQG